MMSVCSFIGGVQFDHLVKVMSARFPHGKVTIFLFKLISHLGDIP